MFNRRTFLFGGSALLTSGVLGLTNLPAAASSDRLLTDILVGISDAVVRNYVRDHWNEARWDGSYYWYEGRRYTPYEWRDHWIQRYPKSHPAPAPAPQKAPPKPKVQPKPQAQPKPQKKQPAKQPADGKAAKNHPNGDPGGQEGQGGHR